VALDSAIIMDALALLQCLPVYGERKRNFVGQHFWARGYFVSTVGRDEAAVREYIKSRGKEDQRLDQLGLWK